MNELLPHTPKTHYHSTDDSYIASRYLSESTTLDVMSFDASIVVCNLLSWQCNMQLRAVYAWLFCPALGTPKLHYITRWELLFENVMYHRPHKQYRLKKKSGGISFCKDYSMTTDYIVSGNILAKITEISSKITQESPRQTKPKKGQFMNFSRGIPEQKFDVNRALFSQRKSPEFTKMGEIHINFSLWPFLWLGLPGQLPNYRNYLVLMAGAD